MKENETNNISEQQKIWSYLKGYRVVYGNDKDIAYIDCTREYTFEQSYNEWNRYARVFSGLGITQNNKSRAALCTAIVVESMFCYFGLNMTGAEVSMFSYPDFLPGGNWKTMIEKEKITDLIISDIMVTPSLWKEIQREKKNLGLKNVILLHTKLGGPAVGPAELVYNEFNYHALRRFPGTYFMNDLLEKYRNTPICYGSYSDDNIGAIAHTSGTANGTRKPIIFSEFDFNHCLATGSKMVTSEIMNVQKRFLATLDLSSVQSFTSYLSYFALGVTTIFTFFGFMHPKYINAIAYYKVGNCFASSFIIDKWLEREELADLDLSSLDQVTFGGSYVSESSWERYKKFFADHGFKGMFTRGYGMSEVMVNAFVKVGDGDTMGQPVDANLIRIRDEDDGKFYRLDEGPRTGILHMSGSSVCRNTFDGEKLFDYVVIDGINFICTNDMIRIEVDGSLVFVGRADKYFVNNEGRRFDSGFVEAQLARHPLIKECAVAPILEKRIHDTVPVLYVVPEQTSKDPAEDIRQALVDVYVREKKINADNIPVQFVLVDELPLNQNGKIDVYRITRERLQGDIYDIKPLRENGDISDIKIEHVDKASTMVASVPEGMENSGSAFNIFELFN